MHSHAGAWEREKVADRLRRSVKKSVVTFGKEKCPVTVSVGIAADNDREGNLERLMRQADRALFRAKKRGRNRACSAE